MWFLLKARLRRLRGEAWAYVRCSLVINHLFYLNCEYYLSFSGLTPSKFIMARDVMKEAHEYLTKFWPGQLDPEIESMELISVYPIELVSLSVFQRRRRRILKARFHNGDHNFSPKIAYFELGGLEKRTVCIFFFNFSNNFFL